MEMWEQLLAAGTAVRLDDRDSIQDWFEAVGGIAAGVRRPMGRPLTQKGLQENDEAWALWVRCVRALWAVAEHHLRAQGLHERANLWIPRTQPAADGPDFTADLKKAAKVVLSYAAKCRPCPIWLPRRKAWVMPNSFNIQNARVARADAGGPGRRNRSGPASAVRAFFVLVFASLLVPTGPICRECERAIPPTKGGRRSRKKVCRTCENARHYTKLKQDPEKQREQWRASKRRIRRKQT